MVKFDPLWTTRYGIPVAVDAGIYIQPFLMSQVHRIRHCGWNGACTAPQHTPTHDIQHHTKSALSEQGRRRTGGRALDHNCQALAHVPVSLLLCKLTSLRGG